MLVKHCPSRETCQNGYCKCWQELVREGNFHDTTHIFFIKSCGFYFAKKSVRQKRKNYIYAKMSTFSVFLA